MKSRRSWWLIYGACTALVLAALAWITVMVVRLERGELQARAEAEHQEALRLALWRMDSWLAPFLAREAARPYFDYEPFYPQPQAYTKLLSRIEPGEVLTPSPLLSFESEYSRLHFQVGPNGRLTSPQVPVGNLRDIAEEESYLGGAQIVSNAAQLESIGGLFTTEELMACVAGVQPPEAQPVIAAAPDPGAGRVAKIEAGLAQQLRTRKEWSKRKGTYDQNIQQAGQAQQAGYIPAQTDRRSVSVGLLVPFWSGSGGGELIFARRVQTADGPYYQGFLCDWPKLKAELLGQITDLFAEAQLVPVRQPPASDEAVGTMLATIPVLLEVPDPVPAAAAWLSPARSTIALTWLAVVAALGAGAVTLRASIAFGEKRSRFASAVTHELRSPLTTFRMYSEMLADGMVRDEEQRQVYYATLKQESGRLTTLVENVLAYAQLEEGRRASGARKFTIEDLLARLTPPLERRAREAGMSLHVHCDAPGERTVVTDVDQVGQILFNLVDNACKYADNGSDPSVELRVSVADGRLRIGVLDHGPGIPARQVRAIFVPFERGTNGGDKPGIGLGLALARGLARDLGGDLELRPRPEGGACFELTLPLGR